jgi:hypothetical protein
MTKLKVVPLLLAALVVGYGRASASTVSGTLTNFDVFNTTGEDCHGFEIELHGIRPQDVRFTFGAPNQRYGNPEIFATQDGALVRYASPWDAASQAFAERTLPAPTPIVPTQGHACWRGGSGNYETSGCEHFGVVLGATPTMTEMYWLVADPAQRGALRRALPKVGLPMPALTVREQGGAAPAVEAVIEAEPPEAERQYGRAYWVKVFTAEHEEEVELEQLVSGSPLVPRGESETEVEWFLLQSGPPGKGHNELARETAASPGSKSVIRRYEFYEYTGAYDPESHEVQCGGDGSCDAPLPGELGNYLGAQMAAVNLGAVLPQPTPTPSPGDTPTLGPTVSPTAGSHCAGDCSGDGAVTIDELVLLVRIALEEEPLALCASGDRSGDGSVTIDEILLAVSSALEGCPLR